MLQTKLQLQKEQIYMEFAKDLRIKYSALVACVVVHRARVYIEGGTAFAW